MGTVRRIAAALVTIIAIAGATPAASAADSPALTRLDTDASGVPNHTGSSGFLGLSGDGRYALLLVNSNSNLVPLPHRTPTFQGKYLVRKDTQSGAIVLAAVHGDGRAFRSGSSAAMDRTGTKIAYLSPEGEGTPVIYLRDLTTGVARPVFTSPNGSPYRLAFAGGADLLTWSLFSGQHLYRHDLRTGQTAVVLTCDPQIDCYVYGGPTLSEDGNTYVLQYRATPSDPIRLSLLDPHTGQIRTLPEGMQGEGFTVSGDGKWVFYVKGQGCPSCGGGRFEIKRIATTPGATPELLRVWQDTVTWTVIMGTADYTGSMVGYSRQTGEAGQWYIAAPGYVHDVWTGQETRLPVPRDKSYSRWPTLSRDGRVGVVDEGCLFGVDCYPTGWYLASMVELLPDRAWRN